MRIRNLLPALFVALAAWGLCAPLRAHPPNLPVFWVDAEVTDEGVRIDLTSRADVMAPWLGLTDSTALPADERKRHVALKTLLAALPTKIVVLVDDRPLEPEPQALTAPEDLNDEDGPPFWRASYFGTAPSRPRKVSFLWKDFEQAEYQGRKEVPLMIKVRREVSSRLLSRGEPEITWHTEDERPPRTMLIRQPEPLPDPEMPVPVLSLVLLVAGLALIPVLRKLDAQAAVAYGAPVALIGIGVVAWVGDLGIVKMDDPFVERITLPSPVQAQELFTTLHDNVYASFDAETEDEIYDFLSGSVDAEMLDGLYADVYESLILRDQGGAVARVDEITRDIVEVQLPEVTEGAPLIFDVRCKWSVLCTVTHWQHRHKRLNSYEAVYTIRHDGRSWKLAGSRLLDQRREDLPEEYGVGLDEGRDETPPEVSDTPREE